LNFIGGLIPEIIFKSFYILLRGFSACQRFIMFYKLRLIFFKNFFEGRGFYFNIDLRR